MDSRGAAVRPPVPVKIIMLAQISICNRQIAIQVMLVIAFILVGSLAYSSLRAVEENAQAVSELTSEQVIVGEISASLGTLLRYIEEVQASPESDSNRALILEEMDRLHAYFEEADGSAYRDLDRAVSSYAQLEQSMNSTLLPEMAAPRSSRVADIAAQRADQVRTLQGVIQRVDPRIRNDVAAKNADTDDLVQTAVNRILFALFIVGVIAVLMITSITYSINSGIKVLTDGAYRLARNQGSVQIQFPVHRKDEFTQLGDDFNTMANAITTQRTSIETYVRDLQVARAQAEAATQRKSAYLANMSHELRAPMHVILNYTTLVAEGEAGTVTDEQRDFLNKVVRSSRELLAVINDVLDAARIEAGQMDVRAEDLDLRTVMSDLETSTKSLIKEQQKPIQLNVTLPKELPPVRADKLHVRQILTNLLMNAVRFTDQGSITVTCGVGPDTITIGVEDTGIGIPNDKLDFIFERFQQAEPGHRGGTGLGLSIARDLVGLQGGRIWVTSVPGKGSAFFFTLPIARKKMTAPLPPLNLETRT